MTKLLCWIRRSVHLILNTPKHLMKYYYCVLPFQIPNKVWLESVLWEPSESVRFCHDTNGYSGVREGDNPALNPLSPPPPKPAAQSRGFQMGTWALLAGLLWNTHRSNIQTPNTVDNRWVYSGCSLLSSKNYTERWQQKFVFISVKTVIAFVISTSINQQKASAESWR